MTPWFESLAAALLAVAGVWLGRWFSRRPSPYWMVGYFVPLVLIVLYGFGMRRPTLSFVPPFSWLVMGRNKFASIAFVTTLILTTPLSRIQVPRARVLISILMALIVAHLSLWPFLAPAFNRRQLAGLKTQIDSDGICLQSTDYNCGPAAAVTALRRLGLPAEEGELAILAHTSAAIGTPPDILARTLQDRYAKDGLQSEFRVFKSLEELKSAGLTLAVIQYNFWFDHYIAVLKVENENIVAGDPALGLVLIPKGEFTKRWRWVGVVLKRPSGSPAPN